MKNRVLFLIMLAVLFVFLSSGDLRAFGDGGFGTPFGNDQSFGSSSPGNTPPPSDAAQGRITSFSVITSSSDATSGGIDLGDSNSIGTTDDSSNRNDAPIGNGLWVLLGIAVMHTLVVIVRKRITKMNENILSV